MHICFNAYFVRARFSTSVEQLHKYGKKQQEAGYTLERPLVCHRANAERETGSHVCTY